MATVNTLAPAFLHPQNFVIDCASTGDNVVINAVPGFTIIVEAYFLDANGNAVTATWKSGSATAGTNTKLSGAMSLAGTSQPVSIESHADGTRGVLRCISGDALVLNMGTGVQVSGHGTCHLE
jgi:hypothetical protein